MRNFKLLIAFSKELHIITNIIVNFFSCFRRLRCNYFANWKNAGYFKIIDRSAKYMRCHARTKYSNVVLTQITEMALGYYDFVGHKCSARMRSIKARKIPRYHRLEIPHIPISSHKKDILLFKKILIDW